MGENYELSFHSVRPVVKSTIRQRNATLEQTQLRGRLPATDDWKDKFNREMPKATGRTE